MCSDWTIYRALGNFLKPSATINLPKFLTFLGIFVNVSISIIFLVKLFLGYFYRHLAIFSGHTGGQPGECKNCTPRSRNENAGKSCSKNFCNHLKAAKVLELIKKK